MAGAVAAVEETTSAELVVAVHRAPALPAVAPLGLAGGLGVGWLALAWCLWSPLALGETAVMGVVVVAGLVGAAAGQAAAGALVPVATRQARARRRARAALVGLGAHRTRARTGVVVLVDEEEGRVALAVDAGVEGAVPMGRLAGLRLGGGPEGDALVDLPTLLRGLRALGRELAVGLPAAPDDNPDELDNAPRVLA